LNYFSKFALVCVALMVLAASLADAKGRKLPIGAYIKSAKISIISGDLDRYPEALAMLDSLAMHYGPHAEALYLTSQVEQEAVCREDGRLYRFTSHVL